MFLLISLSQQGFSQGYKQFIYDSARDAHSIDTNYLYTSHFYIRTDKQFKEKTKKVFFKEGREYKIYIYNERSKNENIKIELIKRKLLKKNKVLCSLDSDSPAHFSCEEKSMFYIKIYKTIKKRSYQNDILIVITTKISNTPVHN